MSYFTGSSSQLSDATMDVRYADPGSSAGRSGVAHGSIDDGHKVRGRSVSAWHCTEDALLTHASIHRLVRRRPQVREVKW